MATPTRKNSPNARISVVRLTGRWLIRLVLYGTLLAIGTFAGLITATLGEVNKLEKSSQFSHREGVIFARDGHTVLRKLRAPTTRHYIDSGAIPKVLASAVVAAEDHRFYTHPGIDLRGTARAALRDIKEWAIVEGGSTITQQMVKNAYLGPRRSFSRKSREALLALAVEARWNKPRILAAYLNTAYFGNGAYGIHDASKLYFKTDVGKLNVAQSAMLAGLLRAPENDEPYQHPRKAQLRRDEVITAMRANNLISSAVERRAKQQPIPKQNPATNSHNGLAAHFVDNVVGDLVDQLGTAEALGGGLRVRTTLSTHMQRAARVAAHSIDDTGLSTAIVAIDPANGEIRALALGGPAATNAFDVTTNGLRQPGSVFKPFTLIAALQSGYALDSQIASSPFTATYPRVGKFTVTNDGGYVGKQSLLHATWFSDNTVFARVAKAVGIKTVINTAHAAGIDTQIEVYPSAILGGLKKGVHPLELAHAYATIANHGKRAGSRHESLYGISNNSATRNLPISPIRIARIDDHHGDVIWEPERTSAEVIPAVVADLTTSALQGVIERGTGTAAKIGRPAAGKTGTTEHNVDAWFVGYTPQLVTAVWVGHVSGSIPMTNEYHGKPVSGGSYPAEIWGRFMERAMDGLPAAKFTMTPARYRTVFVDSGTGLLANAWCSRGGKANVLAQYLPSEKSTKCPLKTPTVPKVVGMTQRAATATLEQAGYEYFLNSSNLGNETGPIIVGVQIPAAGSHPPVPTPIQLLLTRKS